MIRGIGASEGIAIDRIYVFHEEQYTISKIRITDTDYEIAKFKKAIEISKQQIISLKDKMAIEIGSGKADIISTQIMILEDPQIIDSTLDSIVNEKLNCEFLVNKILSKYIDIFKNIDDEYLKERIADIQDVGDRLIRNILGTKIADLSILPYPAIVVAKDITPSQFATIDKSKLMGIITEQGGRTSHTAIMSRTLEIPALVGVGNIIEKLSDGELLILDTLNNMAISSPSNDEISNYQDKIELYKANKKHLSIYKNKDSITIDGKKVELAGNIGSALDIPSLIDNGCEGVGLFRTEFIYMNRSQLPLEDEQFVEYKQVLEALKPQPVVIRTLDIGGDKDVPYLNIDKELNPFLGYRAIRLCLDKVEIFKTQLRALLRASIYGNLRIMFPMISSLEELLQAKEILEEVKIEMREMDILYSDDIEVGIMIEVPSAALSSHILSKHVDFFSIGTNDLTQYTCAVDRMNEKIQHLYTHYNPGVLKLIQMTIANAHKAGIWVGMCGEMAGEQLAIPLLVGMGLDELSMSPSSVLKVREKVSKLSYKDMGNLAERALLCESSNEVIQLLNQY